MGVKAVKKERVSRPLNAPLIYPEAEGRLGEEAKRKRTHTEREKERALKKPKHFWLAGMRLAFCGMAGNVTECSWWGLVRDERVNLFSASKTLLAEI